MKTARKIMPKNLDVFMNKKTIESALKTTKNNYRQYDPGWYLYRMVINYKKKKVSKEFIELVYATLSAWNMNSRGARLNNFNDFEKSIFENENILNKLIKYSIEDLKKITVVEMLRELFMNLKLTEEGKPVLVTFSKTIHFFLPELIAPIDRKYTLNYFYGNTNVPKKKENQFKKFIDIELEFCRISNITDLSKYIDNIWNANIPKILDNAIIGYMKNNE
ncbi:MAG: hypothetical protein RBR74_09130 [Ignavibacteriaceae bacterium]|jgi:hypothetical protein|nr:hypothetical protein [Ignavibacteriaceae bacterium]